MNDQCAYCGHVLAAQEPDGSRPLSADRFCSDGCGRAHAQHAAILCDPAYPEEDPGPERFDMLQLAPA